MSMFGMPRAMPMFGMPPLLAPYISSRLAWNSRMTHNYRISHASNMTTCAAHSPQGPQKASAPGRLVQLLRECPEMEAVGRATFATSAE
mmetsp:Transcript_37432/g.120312  ORF Transcript_37432/g.120312 Transcript_37432/m.120312 type:complete len:89 (+) Transcript_37432:409-675(+)